MARGAAKFSAYDMKKKVGPGRSPILAQLEAAQLEAEAEPLIPRITAPVATLPLHPPTRGPPLCLYPSASQLLRVTGSGCRQPAVGASRVAPRLRPS